MTEPGTFVVSLDLELAWGIRDSRGVEGYRDNLRGVRRAVDAMLERFEQHGVHCTWATVGMLAFEDAGAARAGAPSLRPAYADPRFDPYPELDERGAAEREPDLYFAPELLRRIRDTPGQELGTHTFAHYYCLESGPVLEAFRADLRSAREAFAALGVGELRSIVFPRNQYSPAHLAICREEGILSYRGNPEQRAYQSRASDAQGLVVRAVRLADAHVPVTGSQTFVPGVEAGMLNVRASRFLRPARRIDPLAKLRVRRVLKELRDAATEGRCYHLWWHPHNFGTALETNLVQLDEILRHFSYLRDRYGMRSQSMGELAA